MIDIQSRISPINGYKSIYIEGIGKIGPSPWLWKIVVVLFHWQRNVTLSVTQLGVRKPNSSLTDAERHTSTTTPLQQLYDLHHWHLRSNVYCVGAFGLYHLELGLPSPDPRSWSFRRCSVTLYFEFESSYATLVHLALCLNVTVSITTAFATSC